MLVNILLLFCKFLVSCAFLIYVIECRFCYKEKHLRERLSLEDASLGVCHLAGNSTYRFSYLL